jgi:hypothetical protein
LIPALLSEKEHLYHVKSCTPKNTEAILEGTIINQLDSNISLDITGEKQILSNIITLPDLIDDDNINDYADLSKYIFRQKTMELLYTASKLNRNRQSIIDIKKEMKVFCFQKKRKYLIEKILFPKVEKEVI